ncbi:hypothetical protein Ple7327_4050 [Pleurocapsa sp. PCC 7327]|nr:hypothetical protein Ple7327_4050 [Pleurocapsa sp. PCC 7327]
MLFKIVKKASEAGIYRKLEKKRKNSFQETICEEL